MKDETQTFHLDSNPDNNRFYTLLFVQMADGEPTFRKPWQNKD